MRRVGARAFRLTPRLNLISAQQNEQLRALPEKQGPLSVEQARVLFHVAVGEPARADDPVVLALQEAGLLTDRTPPGLCEDLAFALDSGEPEVTDALNLPSEYGVDDIPMIVQDRAFDRDNQFEERIPLAGSLGVIGDEILVNGTLGPYFDVTTGLVRLRLLNGSNARLYNFGFSDDRAFSLVATDGGLLAEPWETDRLHLSPGERAEIVVAFEPGETVELRSYPSPEYGGASGRLDGFADLLDICRFRAADTLSDDTEVPPVLGAAPDLAAEEVAQERSFVLASDRINDRSMAMDRIDFGVREGTVEVWEVTNDNGYLHNFHVHDVQFQVLTVDGETPPPHLRGWKDTVMVAQGRHYRLAMRFGGHTDPNMPYMYHCHLLQHEDDGMMGQFVVLGEGEEVGTVPAAHDHA